MQGVVNMSRPALAMRPQSQPFGAARQQQAAVRRASLVVRADDKPRVTREYREGEDSVRVPGAPASSSEQPAANPNSQYADDLPEVSWVDGLPSGPALHGPRSCGAEAWSIGWLTRDARVRPLTWVCSRRGASCPLR